MQKLLIADPSAIFSALLAQALSDTYEVSCCETGKEALTMLETLRPQMLILNLGLPYMDGLTVLHTAAYKPQLILVLTTLGSERELQRVKDAGADFAMITPCTVESVVYNVRELTRMAKQKNTQADPQRIVEEHLRRLGIPLHRAGFQQLRVGIPIFAQNETQLLQKELYPVIAKLCGNRSADQVEHTIRKAIEEAWKNRDPAVWEEYFPGWKKAPSNKVFIAVLAQKLRQSAPDRIW